MNAELCQEVPQETLQNAEYKEVTFSSVLTDWKHIGTESPDRFDYPLDLHDVFTMGNL